MRSEGRAFDDSLGRTKDVINPQDRTDNLGEGVSAKSLL
jgi:hypothetical protein